MSVAVTTAKPTAKPTPEFRAGGTDFSERRRSGVSQGMLIDISTTGSKAIAWDADGAAQIGALTTIATIATDARIAAAYPGIAASAQGLATPQVRQVATLGGNLAQRSRCWYFRRADIDCLKKSGSTCPARSGNHLYGVAFDLGDCVAPHPSTMAAALLAYDATITTDQRSGLTIAGLLGDGSISHADHTLAAGEMIKTLRFLLRLRASALPTSARSAGPMRNGRWWSSAPALSSPAASSSSCVSLQAASRPCRFASPPRKSHSVARLPMQHRLQRRRKRQFRAPNHCR